MNDFRRTTDEFKVKGNQLLEKVRQIIDEGNARRIIIKTDSRTLLEIPLTAGVGGAAAAVILMPAWAAIGAIAALVADLEVVVIHDADKDGVAESSKSYRPADYVRTAADRAQDAAKDFAGKARAAADTPPAAASPSTTTAGSASFTQGGPDKTMGSQSNVSAESDAAWSPTHEERGGDTPPAP